MICLHIKICHVNWSFVYGEAAFFGALLDIFEMEAMTVALPAGVNTVANLLIAMHQRKTHRQQYPDVDKLQIVLSRQFFDTDTEIYNHHEITYISRPGNI